MNKVTEILGEIEQDDLTRAGELLPLVYDELRNLAVALLDHEKPGQTLQPTALVHEAYLRLVGNGDDQPWNSRGHFFGAAAEAMRRVMVEQGRRKNRIRHGGQFRRVELEEGCAPGEPFSFDMLALDEALQRLETRSATRAQIVKLRFFAGLTTQEAAGAMGISVATADRYWNFARTWLFAELSDAGRLRPRPQNGD